MSSSSSSGSSGSSVSSDDDAEPERIKWFQRPNDFVELEDLAQIDKAIASGAETGKWTCIEFYAAWCSSCKAAFPALIKIPKDNELAQKFQFFKANIENAEVGEFVKAKSVRGIPYMSVYNSKGEFVVGFTASFKKMAALKASLATIAANPDSERFVLDPNGYAVPA